MVGARQAQQTDLFQTGGLQAVIDHLGDGVDGSLAHRTSDHARLAEPAAAGAAAKDLHRVTLVDGLGNRDDGLLRIRPLVKVHDGVLGDGERCLRTIRGNSTDRSVVEVFDVVEGGHIDPASFGKPHQQTFASARPALLLPVPDDLGDLQGGLLTVPQDGGVDEVGDGFGIEGGVTADEDDGVVVSAINLMNGDTGQTDGIEHVGVAQLRRQ